MFNYIDKCYYKLPKRVDLVLLISFQKTNLIISEKAYIEPFRQKQSRYSLLRT